jgi:hypothetical protein
MKLVRAFHFVSRLLLVFQFEKGSQNWIQTKASWKQFAISLALHLQSRILSAMATQIEWGLLTK